MPPAADPRRLDEPIRVATDETLVLPTLLRHRAEHDGDRPFLQEVTGREQTYAELDESARRWAAGLHALGVQPGEHVAVLLPPCLEAHHVWIGASRIGARDAPLNPAYRGHLLRHTLNGSRARVLVTRADLLAQVDEVAGELTDLTRIVTIDSAPVARLGGRPVLAWDELAAQGGVAPEHPAPSTADVASLLFTSGTTGPSKGVLVRWGQITVGSELSPLTTFGDDAATYSPYPVYHLSGKIPVLAMARVRGRVVIVEKYSTTRLWDDIAAYRCTSLGLIGALAQFVTSVELRPDQVGHLKYVTMSPCLPTVDEIAARLQVAVGTAYGSTEAGWPLLNRCATAADHLSCGRLREGYELRIVDEHDRDVAVGQVGELLVRSTVPQLMSAGYFELPDKTAEAWRGGWFHTGDAFRRDEEGRYYFLDRTKDAIRRRGENISSFEVETYVEQHPQVERCAAIAVPAAVGEDEVKVCVVPVAGTALSPSALREWLEPRMPRFMVPRYVELVDDLPLTDTGKVKKAELRAAGVNAATFDAERRTASA